MTFRPILPILVILILSTFATAQIPVAGVPVLPAASHGSKLYLADQTNDAIYILEDLSTPPDGDAQDPGEVRVFYDTSTADIDLHIATPQFIAIGPDDAIYCGDSNKDFILRLEDLDLDGTALSTDEAQVYYDDTSGGPPLVSINNMVFDDQGYLYFSDNGTGGSTDKCIVRIRDDNGDHFCSAADGEVLVIYQLSTTTGLSVTRTSGMAIDFDGTLVVTNYDDDNLYRFFDTAGSPDGDANDPGEQEIIFQTTAGATELGFAQSLVFGFPGPLGEPAPLFVNEGIGDTIYRFQDLNDDGFYENPSEAGIVFWDGSQADGIVPGSAWRIAMHLDGSLFVAEGGNSSVDEQIVRLEDLNADLDANDAGEATIFCDNTNADGIVFGKPYALAWSRAPIASDPEFIRGDANLDGGVDIGDAIFILEALFVGGELLCLEAANVNDDEADSPDISDPIYLLTYLFSSGVQPAAPFPDCGADPGHFLGCDETVCP